MYVEEGLQGLSAVWWPGIAWLEDRVGLQQAMLLVPACYLLSGIGFLFAERVLTAETAAKAAKAS